MSASSRLVPRCFIVQVKQHECLWPASDLGFPLPCSVYQQRLCFACDRSNYGKRYGVQKCTRFRSFLLVSVPCSAYQQTLCAPGYKGTLCGACDRGDNGERYGFYSAFTCTRCKSDGLLVFLTILGFLLQVQNTHVLYVV